MMLFSNLFHFEDLGLPNEYLIQILINDKTNIQNDKKTLT